MKQKSKMIKLVGFAVTIIGVGVNLVSDWLDEQKMDEKIEEKTMKHLSRKTKKQRSPNMDSFVFLFGGKYDVRKCTCRLHCSVLS